MATRSGRAKAPARGRATPPGQRRPGRYTPPIPPDVRRSPRWFPWALLALLVLGVLAIILNYVQLLPASPSNWYTLGGLIAILAAALLATRYR